MAALGSAQMGALGCHLVTHRGICFLKLRVRFFVPLQTGKMQILLVRTIAVCLFV